MNVEEGKLYIFDKSDAEKIWYKMMQNLEKVWKTFRNACFLHTTGVRPIILLYVFDTDIAQTLFFTVNGEGLVHLGGPVEQ